MKTLLLIFFPLMLTAQPYEWDSWEFYRTPNSSGYMNQFYWIFGTDAVWLTPAGSIDQKASYVEISKVVTREGVYQFKWEFIFSVMGPDRYEDVEVYLDNNRYVLQDNKGLFRQTGTFTTPYIRPGTRITFRAHAGNGLNGTGESNLVISGFQYPTTQPECNVKIYPNPTQSKVRILLGCYDGTVNISIYDIQGKLLSHIETNQPYADHDLSMYAAGMYIVKVNDKVFKVVKI